MFICALVCGCTDCGAPPSDPVLEGDLKRTCARSALKVVLAFQGLELRCDDIDHLLPPGARSLAELQSAAEQAGLIAAPAFFESKRLGDAPVGTTAVLLVRDPAAGPSAESHYIAAVRVHSQWRFIDFPRVSISVSDDALGKWWTGRAIFFARSQEQLAFLHEALLRGTVVRVAQFAAPAALLAYLAFVGVKYWRAKSSARALP